MEFIAKILAWPENFLTLFCLLFSLAYGYGYKKRWSLPETCSILLFLILFAIPMDTVPYLQDNFNAYLFMMVAFSLVYALLFVDYAIFNVMSTLVSGLLSISMSKGVIGGFYQLLPTSLLPTPYKSILFSLSFYLVMASLFVFFTRHALRSKYELPLKYWFLMQFVQLIAYAADRIAVTSTDWSTPETARMTYTLNDFAFHSALLLVILINYYLAYVILKTYTDYSEAEILLRHQALQLDHLDRTQALVDQIRRDKHELKNLFHYFEAELSMGNYDDLSAFVSSNLSKRYDRLEEFNTGNQFMDYLLTQKVGEARDARIPVIADVVLPADLPFSTQDMCSLLMNLMDNAIDASKKETDAEIHIRLFVDSQYFCISVSNKSSVDVTKTNPHLISTKADRAAHGLGTKVIQSIVDHYHGISRRYMDNGRYVVDIMLPMNSR